MTIDSWMRKTSAAYKSLERSLDDSISLVERWKPTDRPLDIVRRTIETMRRLEEEAVKLPPFNDYLASLPEREREEAVARRDDLLRLHDRCQSQISRLRLLLAVNSWLLKPLIAFERELSCR